MNIKYIGRHEVFVDKLFGIKRVWERNYTVNTIPDSVAVKYLRYKDSFVRTDEPTVISAYNSINNAGDSNENLDIEARRESIRHMDIDALRHFAFANFSGYKLESHIDLNHARDIVTSMVDRFGDAFSNAETNTETETDEKQERNKVHTSRVVKKRGRGRPKKLK